MTTTGRRQSLCANTPLGGPARPAQAVPVQDWTPGQKAAMADLRWDNGATVKVGFLNRPDAYGKVLRQKVAEIASVWCQYANITFQFVEGPTEEVTINFSPDQAPFGTYSSFLGTDSAAKSRAGVASMNLVFDPDDPNNNDDEFRRVILHEFGHALGLIHEHMRPDRPILWDVQAVTQYYTQLTGGAWSATTIFEQVIQPYQDRLADETAFDPGSIMMYPFPKGLAFYTDNTPFESGWNRDLTDSDRTFIAKTYPRASGRT